MVARALFKLVLLTAALTAVPGQLTLAENVKGAAVSTAADDLAIRAVLSEYERALNAADIEATIALYDPDGVVMAPNTQPAVGRPAIRQAIEAVTKIIKLHVKFTIAEIVETSAEWAFVRTSSAGTSTLIANGAQRPEANQELFILKKGSDGFWKVARYSFSNTRPPAP
jgi:uncharacterized protein (TIGR02246 family)